MLWAAGFVQCSCRRHRAFQVRTVAGQARAESMPVPGVAALFRGIKRIFDEKHLKKAKLSDSGGADCKGSSQRLESGRVRAGGVSRTVTKISRHHSLGQY